MALDPIHKRADGTIIDLKVPSGTPVWWKIFDRKTGQLLEEYVRARTPFEAWKVASVALPFSEVECCERTD